MRIRKTMKSVVGLAVSVLAIASVRAQTPLGTAFTYQGELTSAGAPASGSYDLRFRLYDSAAGGTQVGATLCLNSVGVSNGRFAAPLDFGSVFTGQARFLEIEVRPSTGLGCGDATGYTVLSPRQQLTAAPNAAFASNAAAAASATTAGNASNLNNQPASFYTSALNLTGTLPDARLSGNVALLTGTQTFTGAKTFSSAAGTFSGTFSGTGTGLTGLNASSLSSGTLPSAVLSGLYSNALTLSNAANSFTGSGAGLTGLSAANIATGTLADARLSTNIARLGSANAFTVSGNSFAGNVGIGTTSPVVSLDIASANQAAVKLTSPTGSSGSTLSLISTNPTPTSLGGVFFGDTASPTRGVVAYSRSSDYLYMQANGQQLTWTATGRLGINQAAPTEALHINGNALASGTITGTHAGNGSALTGLSAANLTGTVPSAVLSGTYGNTLVLSNAANSVTGSFTGSFTGSGGGLTGLTAGNLVGVVPSASLSGTYSGALTLSNAGNSFTGSFNGSGGGLTGVNASLLGGQGSSFYQNATNLTAGTLGDGRLSTNVPLKNGNNAFTGSNSFGGTTTFNFPVSVNGSFSFASSPNLAPFSTISAVKVNNLNADLLDDLNSAAFGQLSQSQTWSGTNHFAEVNVDAANVNDGTFGSGVLRFGAPNSGEGIASNRTNPAGGNFFGLDFYTNGSGTRRMSITNSGDVGIGTAAPAAKLDVVGSVRSSGGFVFPDGSTQYRAYSLNSTPLVTSGLPGGSTFVISLNGTSATLAGSYGIDRGLDAQTGLPATAARGRSFHLRRVRTTDQQWVNWLINLSSLPLTMTLTVPGGGVVTWSAANARIASLTLITVNGVLMEDAEVYSYTAGLLLTRTVSGSPSVSAPSTVSPAISFVFNSVPLPNTVAFGSVTGSTQPYDQSTGNPTSAQRGPTIQLRTNPFSTQALYNALVVSPSSPQGAILVSGSMYRNASVAGVATFSLHLADDGLPIEDYEVIMSPD